MADKVLNIKVLELHLKARKEIEQTIIDYTEEVIASDNPEINQEFNECMRHLCNWCVGDPVWVLSPYFRKNHRKQIIDYKRAYDFVERMKNDNFLGYLKGQRTILQILVDHWKKQQK